jgi:hypothetical protein
MTLLATPNSDGMTADALYHRLMDTARSEGSQVTYSSDNGAVAAVSGYDSDGSTAFYQRSVVTSAWIYTLQWRWPRSQNAHWQPEITQSAQQFHPDPAPGG